MARGRSLGSLSTATAPEIQYSMKAVKGVILTCDSAVKQLLVMMDDKAEYKFIIQDLDENHVLVKAELYDRVRQELEVELEKNAYTQEN